MVDQPAPLVEQPTPLPTRKLTFDLIAEVLFGLVGALVLFGVDLGVSDADVEKIAAGIFAASIIGGKIVGYFTHDRAV